MKKKKTAKMLKAPILFIVILTLFIIIGYTMKDGRYMNIINNNKLKQIGYSKKEIEAINIDNKYLNYAINHEYTKNLALLINEKDFNINYIDAYLEYIKNNKEAKISDVILLVNNDINYEYNDLLVKIVKEKYFLKTRLDKYMAYAIKYPNLNTNTVVSYVNCNLDYDYYTNIENSDITLNTLLIVNKYYKLEEDFSLDLVTMEDNYTKVKGAKLNKEAYKAFKQLSDAAKLENLSILNQSAYRSYDRQMTIYNNYLKTYGLEWTNKWSAKPGHSEHQTGLSLDILTKDIQNLDEFENTKEFIWMKENAYKFGFILRYPKDGTIKTGYGYEPWHYRYVGIDVAKKIHDENLTFEEYYAYYIIKK